MTTSRIYAYRWPARLVSHKPFAAESYSITPSCIWQVFFRKKNEFSFLFSPFCQRAHFLCKMHNPQAFLPVENSAVPAVQCLVWTVLPLLYIYNKRQKAGPEHCRPRPLSQSLSALPDSSGRELFAICRSAQIKLPLRGKTSPGRGKMSRSDKRGNLASCSDD